MLHDNLHLLRDVVRVEAYPTHYPFHRLATVDFLLVIFLTVVSEFEGKLIWGVVLQHIEDEALLNGLAHGIDVESFRLVIRASGAAGIWDSAEQLHGLRLRSRRECDVGDAGIIRPCCHLSCEYRFAVHFAAVCQGFQLFGR